MQKQSLYETVTAKIVTQLESGTTPWTQPWENRGQAGGVGALPVNFVSSRDYSGINILLLWGEAAAKGYADNRWLTFKQALDMGGNVRKGEKSAHIFYVGRFTPKNEAENGEDARQIPFLKSYCVFNVAQCDGLDLGEAAAPVPECEKHAKAEAIMAATGADIRHGGDRAFYSPAADFVQLPPQAAFFEQINYYRTAFHELGHWTGHKARLAREYGKRFGDTAYAREELVAEMAAAFSCAALGIQPTVRHADYIGSWISVLKGDSRAIFTAASHASKAAEYILKNGEVEALEPLGEPLAIAAE